MTPRHLSDRVAVAPQIAPTDVTQLKAAGFALVINNRPDGEEPGQPTGAVIAEAAARAGLAYRAIPIAGGFGDDDVAEMADALADADGPVLAFCRSGTRSTFLWALAEARVGSDPAAIARAAAGAGYDIAPIRAAVERLARG